MVASALNVSTDDILLTPPPRSNDNCCQMASDLDMFAEVIKEKLSMSTKSESLKLLTLSLSSWSILKTSEYFDVPESMVRKARDLLSLLVCDVSKRDSMLCNCDECLCNMSKRDCMLHDCDECPCADTF